MFWIQTAPLQLEAFADRCCCLNRITTNIFENIVGICLFKCRNLFSCASICLLLVFVDPLVCGKSNKLMNEHGLYHILSVWKLFPRTYCKTTLRLRHHRSHVTRYVSIITILLCILNMRKAGPVPQILLDTWNFLSMGFCVQTHNNCVALVRERTIPTERPPRVTEVSANFCD
jgi:hypothetical protein